jgi:hypothetical protein
LNFFDLKQCGNIEEEPSLLNENTENSLESYSRRKLDLSNDISDDPFFDTDKCDKITMEVIILSF